MSNPEPDLRENWINKPSPRLASQTAMVKNIKNSSKLLENLNRDKIKIKVVNIIKNSKINKINNKWEEVEKNLQIKMIHSSRKI